MMNSKIVRKPIPDYTSDEAPNETEEKRQSIIGPLKMEKKKVSAGLPGYTQINPGMLGGNELNEAYDKAFGRNTYFFTAKLDVTLAKMIGSTYGGSDVEVEHGGKITTGDGYEWARAYYFRYQSEIDDKAEGEIAVLFPRLDDKENGEGTPMDRSISVYVSNKRRGVTMGFIESTLQEIRKKIEQIK